MENKHNIVVGQKVYQEIYHRGSDTEIKEHKISRIGRKYFYVIIYGREVSIDKVSMRHEEPNYSQHSFQVYVSHQEILDNTEKNRLLKLLKSHFDGYSGSASRSNTLHELKSACEILGI